ncbi:lipid II flippase MurJ [Mucilaginibacter sabulilitoris]|uniref:Lipid II flippase MurJ n=1 Tax=Mucilaginibacter sabulilitoris TaxID=1173583 RepID=A0ABZ0TU63_9SPHI|nr:lipid II flippase MurJ [Mucilaginibacter sabulilitoris]WPU95613.1 lipid II flippase MurJ [Mucilaginibacter sabulilitoris]
MAANFLGFLIPVYIAYVYGISKDTDAFFFSYGLVVFGSTIFSGAVKSVIVPFLMERLPNKEALNRFLSSVFYYCFVYLGAITVLSLVVLLIIDHYRNNNFIYYIGISMPIFFFTIINSFFYGILNSYGQFYLAETSPFSRAIIIYVTIFLFSSKLGLSAVILGYNLGEIAKFIHLWYITKYRNKIDISFKSVDYDEVKLFIKEGSYQAISTTISSASPIIDKIVASFLVVGSLSILDYGNRLFMIFTVILTSFLTIILSKWSADVVRNNFDFRKMNQIMVITFSFSVVIFLITTILKFPIVNLLYPKINSSLRGVIGSVLILNMAAFVFNAGNQIINRATIAFKGTNILIQVSIVKSIANVVFDILFVIYYGVIGIAISTIIVNFMGFVMNYYLFVKQKRNYQRAVVE